MKISLLRDVEFSLAPCETEAEWVAMLREVVETMPRTMYYFEGAAILRSIANDLSED
jgi:hypothetical protein